jgi:hypothetical protein
MSDAHEGALWCKNWRCKLCYSAETALNQRYLEVERDLIAAQARIAELERERDAMRVELRNRWERIVDSEYASLHDYVEPFIVRAQTAQGSTRLLMNSRMVSDEVGESWRAKRELLKRNTQLAELESRHAATVEAIRRFLALMDGKEVYFAGLNSHHADDALMSLRAINAAREAK